MQIMQIMQIHLFVKSAKLSAGEIQVPSEQLLIFEDLFDEFLLLPKKMRFQWLQILRMWCFLCEVTSTCGWSFLKCLHNVVFPNCDYQKSDQKILQTLCCICYLCKDLFRLTNSWRDGLNFIRTLLISVVMWGATIIFITTITIFCHFHQVNIEK